MSFYSVSLNALSLSCYQGLTIAKTRETAPKIHKTVAYKTFSCIFSSNEEILRSLKCRWPKWNLTRRPKDLKTKRPQPATYLYGSLYTLSNYMLIFNWRRHIFVKFLKTLCFTHTKLFSLSRMFKKTHAHLSRLQDISSVFSYLTILIMCIEWNRAEFSDLLLLLHQLSFKFKFGSVAHYIQGIS